MARSKLQRSGADCGLVTFAPQLRQTACWPSCWDINREQLVAQVDVSGTPTSDISIPTGRERSAQLLGLPSFPIAVPDDWSLQTLSDQLQEALPLIDGDLFSLDVLDLLNVKLNCADGLKPSHLLDLATEADAHTAHPAVVSESRQAGWPKSEPVPRLAAAVRLGTVVDAATKTSNGVLDLLIEGAPWAWEPAATSVISRSIDDPRPLCAAPSESAVTGYNGTSVGFKIERIGVLSSTTSATLPEGGSSCRVVSPPAALRQSACAAASTTGLSLLTTDTPTVAPTKRLSVGMPQLRPQPQPQPGQECLAPKVPKRRPAKRKANANIMCSWDGCSKVFSQVGNLNRHLRTHNEDKRFPCSAHTYSSSSSKPGVKFVPCYKRFVQKVHMEMHADVCKSKGYGCDFIGEQDTGRGRPCTKRFATPTALAAHQIKHHRNWTRCGRHGSLASIKKVVEARQSRRGTHGHWSETFVADDAQKAINMLDGAERDKVLSKICKNFSELSIHKFNRAGLTLADALAKVQSAKTAAFVTGGDDGCLLLDTNCDWSKVCEFPVQKVNEGGLHPVHLSQLQGPLSQVGHSGKAIYTLMSACVRRKPTTITMLNYTRTGKLFWHTICASPITDGPGMLCISRMADVDAGADDGALVARLNRLLHGTASDYKKAVIADAAATAAGSLAAIAK